MKIKILDAGDPAALVVRFHADGDEANGVTWNVTSHVKDGQPLTGIALKIFLMRMAPVDMFGPLGDDAFGVDPVVDAPVIDVPPGGEVAGEVGGIDVLPVEDVTVPVEDVTVPAEPAISADPVTGAPVAPPSEEFTPAPTVVTVRKVH